MGRILDQAREEYDYVIVDSAPLLASSDSMILSTLVDGVVIVARAGDTSREMVSAAFRHVRRARANIVGLVLNHVRSDAQSTHNYYYSYYGYGRNSEES
jgi:receptor protein-tyrosine kinase